MIPNENVDIWDEILGRVALKALFRFKCTCKYWNSFISQPSFRRSYHSRNPPPPWTFLYHNASLVKPPPFMNLTPLAFEYDDEDYASPGFSYIPPPPSGVPLTLITSSNGFLLCQTSDTLSIYNPLTKQLINLPTLHRDGKTITLCPEVTTLVTHHDDEGGRVGFKVVAFSKQRTEIDDDGGGRYGILVHVYTSELREWGCELLKLDFVSCSLNYTSMVVSLNGIVYQKVWPGWDDECLIAYDTACGSSYTIPFPPFDCSCHGSRFRKLTVGVVCGHLRLAEVYVDANVWFKIWTLKPRPMPTEIDQEIDCYWRLDHRGRVDNELRLDFLDNKLVLDHKSIAQIKLHPYNKDVMYLYLLTYSSTELSWDEMCMASYDVLTGHLECSRHLQRVLVPYTYRRPLLQYILPQWPLYLSVHNDY